MYRDLVSNVDVAQSVVPQVVSGSVNGSGVDLRGYDSAFVEVASGAIVSSGNVTPKLQESDDNSTFTDVAAGDLQGTFPTALAASSVYRVGYAGAKRYVRVVLTLNSGTSVAAAANIVRSRARTLPLP